jgi:hypothetical protein
VQHGSPTSGWRSLHSPLASGLLQRAPFLAAPVPLCSERCGSRTFLARTFLQTEDCIPQTGGLLGKIMTLQSFGVADELFNRALTPRSPRVEGLCPSERMRLMARSGHQSVVQVAPSLEASPHNASKRRTSCDLVPTVAGS